VDGNGNPIADRPGAVNLVIAIFKEENNRPQAVDFKLIDSNLFINVAEGHQTFDFDSLVRSPSPFLIPRRHGQEQVPALPCKNPRVAQPGSSIAGLGQHQLARPVRHDWPAGRPSRSAHKGAGGRGRAGADYL
jgi:hypothetical protein